MATIIATSYEDILIKNGKGIPGVHVALYNLNNVKVAATTTEGEYKDKPDAVNGKFSFSGIDQGQYELRFFGEGFSPADNQTINISGDAGDIDKHILLTELVERASSLVWSSRALIDVFTDLTKAVRSTTVSATDLVVSNNSLHLPSTTTIGLPYTYETNNIDTNDDTPLVSGLNIAVMYADYIQGEGDVKIETTFNNSDYYTWLDTATSTNQLGTQLEAPTFVDGVNMKVRVTITPGSNNTGGQINHLALYTGPNLFE